MNEPQQILFPYRADAAKYPPRCLGCGYLLEHLAEARCPECGRPFDAGNSMSYTRYPPLVQWKYWLPGVCLAVVGGGGVCLLFLSHGRIGWGLSLGTPLAIGAILGYGVRAKPASLIAFSLGSIVFIITGLVIRQAVGLLCGAVLAGLFLFPVGIGVVLGLNLRAVMRQRHNYDQRWHLPATLFLLIPAVVHGAERWAGFASLPEMLATSRTLGVSVDRAWNARILQDGAGVEPRAGASLALVPQSMAGDRSQVGGRKHVRFNRGELAVEVTERDEGRSLAFRFIGQNHLEDRAVALLDGRMDFRALDEQQTKVTVTTRYRPLMTPRWYWRPVERLTGRDVHEKILDEMESVGRSE